MPGPRTDTGLEDPGVAEIAATKTTFDRGVADEPPLSPERLVR